MNPTIERRSFLLTAVAALIVSPELIDSSLPSARADEPSFEENIKMQREMAGGYATLKDVMRTIPKEQVRDFLDVLERVCKALVSSEKKIQDTSKVLSAAAETEVRKILQLNEKSSMSKFKIAVEKGKATAVITVSEEGKEREMTIADGQAVQFLAKNAYLQLVNFNRKYRETLETLLDTQLTLLRIPRQ